MSNLRPSDYTTRPMYSVAERIARNIMVILARTGNEWIKAHGADHGCKTR